MTYFYSVVAGPVLKDHTLAWISLAAITPAVYLLLKKRKQGFLQKWVTRYLLKHSFKNKIIEKRKTSSRLLLSLLFALGVGLIFGLLIGWELGVAVGSAAFLLGWLAVFKSEGK